jgi:hypothetical protein
MQRQQRQQRQQHQQRQQRQQLLVAAPRNQPEGTQLQATRRKNGYRQMSKCLNVYYCETVSEQRAARCIVAPGGPHQRRWEAHPGIPPPVPRIKKHETPERD